MKGCVINWDGENRTGAMEWDNGTGTMGRGHWDACVGTWDARGGTRGHQKKSLTMYAQCINYNLIK